MPDASRQKRLAELNAAIKERVLVIDGAMGTMIQALKLEEADFRGDQFRDWPTDLKGNNDFLVLTKPDAIEAIHRQYFEAGADFAETNTFSATTIAQADYKAESLARDINVEAAKVARRAADAVAAETGRTRWVIGVLGPTNRTASISPDVNDPGMRNVTFEELRVAYKEAAEGLIEGGADLLMVETSFDTLNAKAALFAIDEACEATGEKLPVMVSGTITDKSGRTLSGQTPEALWLSVSHADLFSVGLNCALGAKDLRPFIADISRVAEVYVTAHPNAGLPNEYGEYEQTPEDMAAELREWLQSGLLNVVGGCCGTTPEHIRAIADEAAQAVLRARPEVEPKLRLSGLEAFAA